MTTPTGTPPAETTAEVRPGAPDPEELARLRAELTRLHARLETSRRRGFALLALRRVAAAVFIMFTAFALVASVAGGWAATTVLSTDRWVATVTPLPKDPQIAAAVSEYATTQVFSAVDVQRRVQEVLPPQAGFVAAPISAQLRTTVYNTVRNVMGSDKFQTVWVELNRQVHDRLLAVVEGDSPTITAGDDQVQIDLLPLINEVLRSLSAQLPTLFGRTITLPDLSSGEIPENLRVRVQDALGVTLPANFAQFTVYDSGQLFGLQQSVADAKRYLALFVAGTVLLLVIALVVSPWRRRTLLQLGLWLIVAAVAVSVLLRHIRDQVLAQVPEGVYRDGAAAAVTSVFSLLRERGTQLIWIGAVLALVAYLAGPGRGATWLRGQVARGAVAIGRGSVRAGRWLGTYAPGWVAAHLDVLRVAGLVVGAILALVLSSWTSLLVVVIVLAAYEIGVTLVARAASEPAADAPVVPSPGEAI